MAYGELWRAVGDQARVWSGLKMVRDFAVDLPRNMQRLSTGMAGLLQGMEAGGAEISGYPMRAATLVGMMLQAPFSAPMLGSRPSQNIVEAWLHSASQIESAHQDTITWLRARMPGAPLLPAPQMARGAPLRSAEWGTRLIWPNSEQVRQYQFVREPLRAVQFLAATPDERVAMAKSVQEVSKCLENSDEWRNLTTLTRKLDEDARTQLRGARTVIQRRLQIDEIDRYSDKVIDRVNYREAVVKEETSKLAGLAKDYAASFEKADHLVETSASNVFGQLVAYGEPLAIKSPREIDLRPPTLSFRFVTFTRTTDMTDPRNLLHVGRIVSLDDPLFPDAIRLLGGTFWPDMLTGGAVERWTGVILTDSGNAWRE